jgi:hypothetical protein
VLGAAAHIARTSEFEFVIEQVRREHERLFPTLRECLFCFLGLVPLAARSCRMDSVSFSIVSTVTCVTSVPAYLPSNLGSKISARLHTFQATRGASMR